MILFKGFTLLFSTGCQDCITFAILHNIAIQQNVLPIEVANEDNEIDVVQDNQINPNYLHEGRRIQKEIINMCFNDQQ
ncbi:hypothetical protein RN001_001799 [Aquatica leii]|uniref:Uncharacterized protein n=1 Tax=Aquatica leii TaxID=1421715 RepID=A0AAN7QN32_9COLE|nr:hypothetical protein RN001_001799 [Aquatica leii]